MTEAVGAFLFKWLTILAGVMGALLGFYYKGRSAGVKAQREKLKATTKATEDKFDEIDERADSIDDALRRLDMRAKRSD